MRPSHALTVALVIASAGLASPAPAAEVDPLSDASPIVIGGRIETVTRVPGSDVRWAIKNEGSDPLLQLMRYDPADAQWTRVPTPDVGKRYTVVDIAMTSVDNGWATANTSDSDKVGPILLHWNGSKWSRVRPDGINFSRTASLDDLSASAASNVWMTGQSSYDTELVYRFDGTSWQIMQQSDSRYFRQVQAVGTDQAWLDTTNSNTYQSFMQHWTGSQWRRTNIPDPDATINSISASSPDSVWIETYNITESTARWTGDQWKKQRLPGEEFEATSHYDPAIDATANGGAWFVGLAAEPVWGAPPPEPYIAVHDSSGWTRLPAPDVCGHGNILNPMDVDATNAGAIVVGSCGHYYQTEYTLALRYQNGQWTRI